MGQNDVTVRFLGDTLGLDRAGKQAENITTKIGGAFSDMGNRIGGDLGNLVTNVGDGLTKIGQAGDKWSGKMIAMGGASVALGTGLQILGSKDQAAEAQLRTSIEATGASWSDYEGKVREAVKSGENFAHSASDTENALQTLTSATGDPAKALQYLQVTMDLAAARHMDLDSAAQAIARTLEGNTRLLKQYGISLDGVGSKTDQAARATDQLEAKLAGQAAASVDSFAGRIDVVKTKLGDLVSQFAGPVGAGLQGFGAGLALVGTVMQSGIITRFRTAMASADGFRGKLSTLKGALVGGAGIAAALTAVSLALNEVAKDEEAVQNAQDAWASGDSNAKLKATMDQLGAFPDLFGRTWKNTFQSMTHSNDVLAQIGVSVQDLTNHVGDSDSAWTAYRQKLLDASDAAGNNGSTTGLLADNLDKLRAGAVAAGKADSVLSNTIHDSTGEITAQTQAEAAGTRAAQEHADAEGYLTKMVKGTIQALQDKLIASYDARDADLAAKKAIKDLGKSHKETQSDVEAAMRSIVDAAQKTADKYTTVTSKNQGYINELLILERTTKPGSPLRKALDAYIAQVEKLNTTINTKITATVNGKPITGTALSSWLARTHPTAAGGYISGQRAAASGGDFTTDEHGYEARTWLPGGGFRVTPHSGSMNSGPAPVSLQLVFPNVYGTKADLARAIKDGLVHGQTLGILPRLIPTG